MRTKCIAIVSGVLLLATLLIILVSLTKLGSAENSPHTADDTHAEEMQNTEPETRYFTIDDRVSGASGNAVVITAECTLISSEQTESALYITCGNFNQSVTDILGVDTIVLNCADRVRNNADAILDDGDDAIVEFGWPQGETPPRASLDTVAAIRRE